MTLRKWRRIAIPLVLAFFAGLYFVPGETADRVRAAALSLHITPALSHGGFKALLAVLFLVMALAFGRLYCSVLCPAGLAQELFLRLGRLLRLARLRFVPPGRPRLFLLALACLGLVGTVSVLNWLDPLGLFGRLAGAAAALWRRDPGFLAAAAPVAEVAVLVLGGAALVIVPLFRGRWFCDRLCPVGALLGLASAAGGGGIRIEAGGCVSCGSCERVCQTRCIDAGAKRVDPARCVVCLDCLDACAASAVSFGRFRPAGRRDFFRGAFGAAAGGLFAFSRNLGERLGLPSDDGALDIAPPGARSHAAHRQGCVSCQACVGACPVGIVQPRNPEMRPVLDYNLGFCQYDCAACTDSCPAGALDHLSIEEKRLTRIAKTVLHLERCVVLTQGTACGACAEVCPTHAVTMVEQPGPGLPTKPDFAAGYCIGCGGCYHVCPAEPRAFAISGLARPEKAPGVRQTAGHPPKEADGPAPAGDVTEFPF